MTTTEPLPLAHHVIYQTNDVDEARDKTARLLRPHRLNPVGRITGFEARHHSLPLRHISLNYVAYSPGADVQPGELETWFAVMAPRTGRCDVRSGTQRTTTAEGSAAVVSPDDPLTMRWADNCSKLILRFDRKPIEDLLSRTLHRELREPLRFALHMDLTRGFGLQYWSAVEAIVASAEDPESLLSQYLVLTSTEQVLMGGLLVSQKHNYSTLLATGSLPASQTVQNVVDRIEADPRLPMTVTDLADGAGCSVRALQLGFRKYHDTTPTAYLRETRLQRAHDELASADPASGLTVTTVAYRWGFAHSGRFAASYRKRFSESPSETLHG